MSIVVRKRKQTITPDLAGKVDWSNPLNRGMKALIVHNTTPAFDIVQRSWGTTPPGGTEPELHTGKQGKHHSSEAATDCYTFPLNAEYQLTGSMTAFCYGKFNTLSGASVMLGVADNNDETEAANFLFIINILNTTTIRVLYEYGAGNNVIVDATVSPALVANDWRLFTITRETGATSEVKIYLDGVLLTTSSGLTNASGGTNATLNSMFGQDGGAAPASMYDGDVILSGLADRAWSEQEVKQHSENIWQLLKPKKQYIFLEAAVASNPVPPLRRRIMMRNAA